MSTAQRFPATDAGPFPEPPTTFDDRENRTIEIRRVVDDDLDGIVDMYATFDPAQRAQGIPPTQPTEINRWLRTVIDQGHHLVAVHESDPVGHAMLVPDGDDAMELAIFVHQDVQRAGIGRALLTHLLGAGAAAGDRRIWLTVERWNAPAIELYRDVGFETVNADRFDLEMALEIPEDQSV